MRAMFKRHKNIHISIFSVGSLSDALNSNADFMVFVSGDSSSAKLQFRDIGANVVMLEEFYGSAQGMDSAISDFTSKVEAQMIPEIQSLCD